MVAARGAGGDVVPLKQDAVDAAQCAIAHDAGAGGATPHDDDLCGDSFHSCPSHLFQIRPVWRLHDVKCLIWAKLMFVNAIKCEAMSEM